MLKSFIRSTPTILQSEQLIVLAIVNGRGIESADLVAMTWLTAANGDANRIMYIFQMKQRGMVLKREDASNEIKSSEKSIIPRLPLFQ